MGGIGGYLSMLNGTETQTFGKEADGYAHLSRSKDQAQVKMGFQDGRFYSQEAQCDSSQDMLPISYPSSQSMGALGGSRFYTHSSFNGLRTGQAAVEHFTGPSEAYSPSYQHGYPQRAPLYPLPGVQVCGKTQALLNNFPLWAKFHKYQTEMIITKQGRRMFPFLSFNISALDPSAHYNVYVDVILADQHHWRYQGGKWVQCGKAEGNMPGNRMYTHPDSPNTGAHWMRQEVSFSKLKLTNNKGSSNNVGQMIVLQSLHKYQPRLHIVEVKEDGSEDSFLSSKAQSFVFPETQFIAVTAYQNADITQLKIDHNPFAKGFRDNYDTLYATPDTERLTPSPPDNQQLIPGSCYHQPYLAEQYLSPLPQGRFFGRDWVSMTQQPKDSGVNPHSHWYMSNQQGASTNRLDCSSFEADYSSSSLYKPYPLQGSAHAHLTYYAENPFTPGSVSSATSVAWGAGRPSSQYINHSHVGKHATGLSWLRPMPSSSTPSLLEPLAAPVLPDKPKEAGEDSWLEPPSVKSVDSADSGLYDGAESKKRRVSPYVSSTESSPPNRSAEACEKDSGSDAGYYGFYSH